MKFLSRVQELALNGIDVNSRNTHALHGTSLWAIRYLAVHGCMPTTSYCRERFHTRLNQLIEGCEDPYNEAIKYAKINTGRILLFHELWNRGIDYKRFMEEICILTDSSYPFEGESNNDKTMKRLKSWLNFDDDYQLVRYYQKLIKAHYGVVLSLSAEVDSLPKAEKLYVAGEEDLVVVVPNGLPIHLINGIEALGKFEKGEIANGFPNIQPIEH